MVWCRMTRKKQLHDIEMLKEIVSYDPISGAFRWLPRKPEMFKRPRAYKAWAARFENKEAFVFANELGYKRTVIFGVSYYAHRLAWALHFGQWPIAEIDHINGDPSDNRIENLRSVDHTENCRNLKRHSDNVSGVTGVSWCKDREKWQAYISDGQRRIPLGRYNELHEAVIARKAAEAALRYHPNHGRP